MPKGTSTIRPSYIDLRGINLGMEFIRENQLRPGQKYSMVIEGVPDADVQGDAG